MALILNLYKDAQCKTPALSPVLGVAGITGYYADKSHWQSQTLWDHTFYRVQLTNSTGRDGVILSGGVPIFDFQRITDREIFTAPDTHSITTDTRRNGQTGKVYNIFFAGINTQSGNRLTANTIGFTGSQSPNWFNVTIRLQQYIQEPIDATGQNRTLWIYNNSAQDFSQSAQLTGTLQQCVCAYKFPMWDDEFYLFALGVSAGGKPNSDTRLLAVPVDFFQDKEIKPYVGPVSKESAESAFIGIRSKESVLPRDLSISPNPYGFNRNGVYLCKCDRDSYNKIIAQMYNGLSGNLLNLAGQVISSTIGGNARRPRDEIATMIDGVLCCHSVPVLGGYPSTGSVDLTSICGYSMYSVGEMLLQTVDPIQHETITTGIIPRQTGNYLDFAPYTTVTLTIPILGSVTIDPSAILGRSLSLHFGIDLFSGVLSCDISIIEPDGTSWIYTTLQGNAVTDMPIMGAGANANPLLKIANGAMGIASGNMSNVVGGIYSIYDGIQTASYAAPISRVSHTGANLLLSPYEIYLTVTTPDNINAEDFWSLAGIPSHMSGTVGDFTGYTVFEHVDLSGVSGATDSELSEIENTLKGGVWL